MDLNNLVELIFSTNTLNISLMSSDKQEEIYKYILKPDVVGTIVEYLEDNDSFDYSTLTNDFKKKLSLYIEYNLIDRDTDNDQVATVLELLGYTSEDNIEYIRTFGCTYDELLDDIESLIANRSPYGVGLFDLHLYDIASGLINMLNSGNEESIELARCCLEEKTTFQDLCSESYFDVFGYHQLILPIIENCHDILYKVLKDRNVAEEVMNIASELLNNSEDSLEDSLEDEVEHFTRLMLNNINKRSLVASMYIETVIDCFKSNNSVLNKTTDKLIIHDIYDRLTSSLDITKYLVEYDAVALATFFNFSGCLKRFEYDSELVTELVNNGLNLDFVMSLK